MLCFESNNGANFFKDPSPLLFEASAHIRMWISHKAPYLFHHFLSQDVRLSICMFRSQSSKE
jgi:hypothetical protein